MANTYSDFTGILTLKKVTPIIQAIFGNCNLDANYPSKEEVFIGLASEGDSNQWSDVVENFKNATALNIEGLEDLLNSEEFDEADESDQAKQLFLFLGSHYGSNRDEEFSEMINQGSFEEEADLQTLFDLAQAFDDGHGLAAIEIEGSWHCDKLHLFEFGGYGHYQSRNFSYANNSNKARSLGEKMNSALVASNLDAGAACVLAEVENILNGVADVSKRDMLRQKLGEIMTSGLVEKESAQLGSVEKPATTVQDYSQALEQMKLFEELKAQGYTFVIEPGFYEVSKDGAPIADSSKLKFWTALENNTQAALADAQKHLAQQAQQDLPEPDMPDDDAEGMRP